MKIEFIAADGSEKVLKDGLALQAGKGIKKCFLEVRVSNHKAQALYKSMCFSVRVFEKASRARKAAFSSN